jgi:formylglycine-generating enzyme required for sulfatase activity
MVWIPAGSFLMGSEEFYPEERPVRRVEVESFWIDERPVTVADFRRFVKSTGYVTVAERPLDPTDYPDADPDALVPGRARVPRRPRSSRSARLPAVVGGRAGRNLEPARGPRQRYVHTRAPPRAAYSHSASVGSTLPAQAA